MPITGPINDRRDDARGDYPSDTSRCVQKASYEPFKVGNARQIVQPVTTCVVTCSPQVVVVPHSQYIACTRYSVYPRLRLAICEFTAADCRSRIGGRRAKTSGDAVQRGCGEETARARTLRPTRPARRRMLPRSRLSRSSRRTNRRLPPQALRRARSRRE